MFTWLLGCPPEAITTIEWTNLRNRAARCIEDLNRGYTSLLNQDIRSLESRKPEYRALEAEDLAIHMLANVINEDTINPFNATSTILVDHGVGFSHVSNIQRNLRYYCL